MLDTCPFGTGQYKIIAKSGPVGTGTHGNRIVVKDALTFLFVQNYYGPGNYTYSIYAKYHHVTADAGNIIFDDTTVYPDEWVITPCGGNTYTIMRKNTRLAWTDRGTRCKYRLHLTPLLDYVTDQQKFTIVQAENEVRYKR